MPVNYKKKIIQYRANWVPAEPLQRFLRGKFEIFIIFFHPELFFYVLNKC